MIIAKAEDQASRVGLEGKVLPAFHSVLAQDRAGGRCDWALPKVQVPFLSHIIPVYWGIFIATIEMLLLLYLKRLIASFIHPLPSGLAQQHQHHYSRMQATR